MITTENLVMIMTPRWTPRREVVIISDRRAAHPSRGCSHQAAMDLNADAAAAAVSELTPLLAALVSPDTQAIRGAEKVFDTALKTQPERLLVALLGTLHNYDGGPAAVALAAGGGATPAVAGDAGAVSPHAAKLCCVLLRTHLVRGRAPLWPRLAGATRDFAKATLLALLEREHVRDDAQLAAAAAGAMARGSGGGGEMRKQLRDCVGELAAKLLAGDDDEGDKGAGAGGGGGGWVELPPLLLASARSPSPVRRESALELIGDLADVFTSEPMRGAPLGELAAVVHAGLADSRSTSSERGSGGVVWLKALRALSALLVALAADAPPSASAPLASCVEPLLGQLADEMQLHARWVMLTTSHPRATHPVR